MFPPAAEQAVYDKLWTKAEARFRAGEVEADPYLAALETDMRRGISLVARLEGPIRARLADLMADLRALAPAQYLYHAAQLHLTVLSLISCAPGFTLADVPVKPYKSVFEGLFPTVAPIKVHLRGLTASPSCVMLCGYPQADALNALRGQLRDALQKAGLGGTLDRRYRLVTAHATLLRFQTTPARLPALADYIAAHRSTDWGACRIDRVEFVFNDWYMSRDHVRRLAHYPLGAHPE